MDFIRIEEKYGKVPGQMTISPDFVVDKEVTDIMIRGGKFYAVWDQDRNIWSTDESDVARLVDKELDSYAQSYPKNDKLSNVSVAHMRSFRSGSWRSYKQYMASLPDFSHTLDTTLTFLNSKTKKTDYVSKSLSYALEPGDYSAYDELMSILYSEDERAKIEWAIGSIVTGASKSIQKFLVLYGDAGTGKSTVLNIIQMLFEGYYGIFDAKSLTSSNNSFATEAFKSNPLVGIQHDGDLSRIEDNSILNSIVSHEEVIINEKYKSGYPMRMNAFLFMATNKPVKITDAKSGLLRRLIDVHPTGDTIPMAKYNQLMKQIETELGAIAYHCAEIFKSMGKTYYNSYKPTEMMFKTDFFYNFVDEYYFDFEQDDGITLKAAYALFKQYCDEGASDYKMPMYRFREELKNYFQEFDERLVVNGKQVRSWFSGFKKEKFPQFQDEVKTDIQQIAEAVPLEEPMPEQERHDISEDLNRPLDLNCTESLLDDILADCPAQYTKLKQGREIPKVSWDKCSTVLKDIDTHKIHYVRPPLNHIVIDLDIKNANGEKDQYLNRLIAAKLIEQNGWPMTYAEFSKGGSGLHLHYIYEGDPLELDNQIDKDIEIKVFSGLLPLRRRLTYCNDIPVAYLPDGSLPKKGAKVVNEQQVNDERHLRNLIKGHLRKAYVPSTHQSIGLIKQILDDAYNSGMEYDVTNMKKDIMNFASQSTNHAFECIAMVAGMKFSSESPMASGVYEEDAPIVFYDIEIFPGDKENEPLLLVNWKYEGPNNKVVRMINPSREDVEKLFHYKLIGFNCRRYDNHILYAYVYEGYTIQELYRLSNRIINGGKTGGNKSAFFGAAYNLSYTDIYDFCSTKQSLKKWEIKLGKGLKEALKYVKQGMAPKDAAKKADISIELLQLHLDNPGMEHSIIHKELGLPWDKPVPKERWIEVAEYCDNDVLATEAVWIDRQADWTARKILAALSGLSVNDTTNQHTTKIIFGDDKNPQSQFNYRNLAKADVDDDTKIFHYDFNTWERIPGDDGSYSIFYEKDGIIFPVFPGYEFDHGKSTYRGEEVGEGGYVYAEQGIFWDVGLSDSASHHPSSMRAERFFGKYQKNMDDLLDARIAIKHGDFETAKTMLNGKLAPFLDNPDSAKDLAQALKIAINSVYGLTSASFVNPFKDPRNIDNFVAKRGALFMINLKHEVQKRGFTVAHIKTDSIKIPNATKDILDFVYDYGKLYGYTFEHEATYDRMCLVNDAVYIAKYASPEWCQEKYGYIPGDNKKHPNEWTATGTEFQVPYVFKMLFSKEPIEFYDMCETKTVTTALYLDLNEGLPDVTAAEEQLKKLEKKDSGSLDAAKQNLKDIIAKGHNYQFIGRAGLFVPIKAGKGGGELVREKDGKFSSAGGAKGYRWLEADYVETFDMYGDIDESYYHELVLQAKGDISEHGSFENFVSDNPNKENPEYNEAAYEDIPCGVPFYESCFDCPKCKFDDHVSEWFCEDHYDIGPRE